MQSRGNPYTWNTDMFFLCVPQFWEDRSLLMPDWGSSVEGNVHILRRRKRAYFKASGSVVVVVVGVVVVVVVVAVVLLLLLFYFPYLHHQNQNHHSGSAFFTWPVTSRWNLSPVSWDPVFAPQGNGFWIYIVGPCNLDARSVGPFGSL